MADQSDNKLDKPTLEFIKAFGILVSEGGLPPSIGKVLGLLVIAEPSKQTAEQIGTKLKLSTGSVSAATNLLIRFGYVRQVTMRGDRRYYYEFEPTSWQNAIDTRLAQMKHGIELADSGLKIRKNDPRLIGMRSVYVQIYDVIKDIKLEVN